ncbi:hypothetical protein TNCV_76821 [Trichonephila clavipes]|nr:hypothetical protein TNCV_76821 [Trichonephila clavipes]
MDKSLNDDRQRPFGGLSELKNIIEANCGDENEVNTVAPVPTSSEVSNIMTSMSSYLDAHSNAEMNLKNRWHRNLMLIMMS